MCLWWERIISKQSAVSSYQTYLVESNQGYTKNKQYEYYDIIFNVYKSPPMERLFSLVHTVNALIGLLWSGQSFGESTMLDF